MIRITTAGLCLLASVTSLQARTVPKAVPSPKLQACDAMGPGFVRMEGSDTCVKLSGSVRVEFGKQSGGSALSPDPH